MIWVTMITEWTISNRNVDWEIYNGEIRPTDLVSLKLEPLDTVVSSNIQYEAHMKYSEPESNQTSRANFHFQEI